LRRLAVLLIGALLAGGCGGGDDDRSQVPAGGALTVYTSLPRHGDSAGAAAAVLDGQKLALDEQHGRAGGRAVRLVALDSAKPDGPSWDPDLVEANAKRAAADRSTIAYLGELDLGGSAISVPVTNDKAIAELSPLDGLTSLTQIQPGGARGGPERYYPSGTRTFARLAPTDFAQATALVDWARERGARRIAIVHDDQLYGRGIAAQAVFVADARRLPVPAVKEVHAADEPEAYDDAARSLAAEKERPDAVVYAGIAHATAEPLLRALHAALPGAALYAAGVAPERPLSGAGPVRIVATTRPAAEYPARARRVLAAIAKRRGSDAPVPVAALYGYESMRLTLEAIERAGPRAGDRDTVRRELLRPGPRGGSVLGDLALTGAGDVVDQRVSAYRRDGAQLAFEGLRTPRPPALAPAPGDPGS
jgi:branched-chain amino acid transport system substrate-binding protein